MSTDEADVPMDVLAKTYLRLRARQQEMEREHEAAVAVVQEQRNAVALAMKDRMLALGDNITSLKTSEGTIMLTTKTRYYASDWEEMHKFILENQAVDLLEKRLAQTALAAFLEANPGKVPPGLNSVSETDVSVRKPTK